MSDVVRRTLRSPIFWILLFGTLLRLALAPVTEDPWDLKVWKQVGEAMDAGQSPYAIESELPFAYPPLWSIFCWLGYRAFNLSGNQLVFNLALKLPLILADLACALLLWRLVQRVTTSRRTALTVTAAYFLNPITIAVSSMWGMFDALPAFLVLVSILLLADGRDTWSALVLGVSAGFKGFYTAFYLPFFVFYVWKKERNLTAPLRYALCFCLAPLAISLPFLLTDARSYLAVFATHATRVPQNLNVGYWLWRVVNPDLRDRLGLPTAYAFAILFPLLYLAVLARARRWTVDGWSDRLAFLVKGAALLCLAYYATSKVVNEQFLVWGLALLALYAWLYDPRAKPFFYALCLIDLIFISLNAGPHFFHQFVPPPAWWYQSPLLPRILGWVGLIFWLTVVACFVTLMRGGGRGRRVKDVDGKRSSAA